MYIWAQFTEDTYWKPGTVLVIPSDVPSFEHYLMVDYIDFHNGEQYAMHSMPKTGIARVTLREALGGKTPRIWWEPRTQQEALAALTRMRNQLGKPYFLAAGNCEHPVRWAITGKWESKQVSNVATGLLLSAGLFALLKS
jgi:hypothetical protein